jgi:hypothetical protein
VALRDRRRDDTVGFIRVPYTELVPEHPEWEQEEPTEHQIGIHAFAYFLSKEGDSAAAAALESVAVDAGWWMKAQSAMARLFSALGNWLSQGVQERRKERIGQTTKVAMAVLGRREQGRKAAKQG